MYSEVGKRVSWARGLLRLIAEIVPTVVHILEVVYRVHCLLKHLVRYINCDETNRWTKLNHGAVLI